MFERDVLVPRLSPPICSTCARAGTCYGNGLVTNTVTRLSAGLMIIIIPHLSCHHNVQPAMRKQIQCFENQLIDNEITGLRSR